MTLLHRIGQKPIIAAIREPDDVQLAIESQVDHLFFMGGTVHDIIHAVRIAKKAGKGTFVHLDLIRGLSSTDKEAVSFIAEYVGADGIVSPKSHQIKEAKKIGLYGVLHLFVLDSLALENGLRLANSLLPDAIELMPGVVPKVIRQFADTLDRVPIIASGLIQTVEEAAESLQAGATCLSVSSKTLWNATFTDFPQIA
ncbi:glycerol-3-phosphate responsive antiterminator [Paenibacillus hodogayensis]|uniref:Glycerol uptake operon antiterminator regulatory protein n=1 Tax=Paenibacillus hodogayensis TaxID=279208 RepID=A0ABV5W3L8_9BACL